MLDIEKKLFLKTKLMTFRNKVELREKKGKNPKPKICRHPQHGTRKKESH